MSWRRITVDSKMKSLHINKEIGNKIIPKNSLVWHDASFFNISIFILFKNNIIIISYHIIKKIIFFILIFHFFSKIWNLKSENRNLKCFLKFKNIFTKMFFRKILENDTFRRFFSSKIGHSDVEEKQPDINFDNFFILFHASCMKSTFIWQNENKLERKWNKLRLKIKN